MNLPCAACSKPVYPVEKLTCLDLVWHKNCFRCQTCKMILNMKNYKGFEKKPYCAAHYPKLSATSVADTPEMNRLKEQSKLVSQVNYHAEYEKNKDQFTVVAETPEMALHKANSNLISNATYDQRDYSTPADAGGYNPPPSLKAPSAAAVLPTPKAAPAPAAPQQGRYRAQFSYEAADDDEVSFNEGDIILDGQIVADGWMKGTVERTGASGLLPSNYVEPA